jgi:hypothetical protein
MAKKAKAYTSWWMLLATALLSAAWLMKPLPVLMLAAFAPLIAISEEARPGIFWEKLEYILVAFLFSFWAAHMFELAFVLPALLQAIAATLVFAAATLTRTALGPVASAFMLVSGWLALEYALLRAGLAGQVLFLADAFSNQSGWTGWNMQLGYLAAGAWILPANLALYKTFWTKRKLHIGWLVIFLAVAAGPVVWSLALSGGGIGRIDMMSVYGDGELSAIMPYAKNGEVAARTGAWVAALVILFTLVKLKTSKIKR